MSKVCSKCKEKKNFSEFRLIKGKTTPSYRSTCKRCEYTCRVATPDKRARYLEYHKTRLPYKKARKYGLTIEEYNTLVKSSKGKCAICSRKETSVFRKSSKVKTLSVDHCHKTGVVRGLLCRRCNLTLGYVEDDISLLKKLIKYLQAS